MPGASATVPRPASAPKRMPKPPREPGTARVVAIANQKGGVGKSTTAVSLGAALAEAGYRVLSIDLDPQGNASTGMGIRHEARRMTVYDVIVAGSSLEEAITPTAVAGLDGVPSTIDLAGAEIELVSQFSRETRLKKALEPVREGRYDFVLLDCPPSLGLLTINALTAAEELIVPIQCEYYALEGLGQLLRNVSLVQHNLNPGLRLTGIVMTMFDPRTKLSEQVVEEVQRHFGSLVYDVIIPRTVRLSEAPGFGQPITVYDPRSKGAETYRELAREVALRPKPTGPIPSYDTLPEIVVPAVSDNVTPTVAEPAAPEPSVVETEAPTVVPEAQPLVVETPPPLVHAEPDLPPDPAPPTPQPDPRPPTPQPDPAPPTPVPDPSPPSPQPDPSPPTPVPDPAPPTPQPDPPTPDPSPIRSSAPPPQPASSRRNRQSPPKHAKRGRGSARPKGPEVAKPQPGAPAASAPPAETPADPAPVALDDFWEEVDLSPQSKVRPPASPPPPGERAERPVTVVGPRDGRRATDPYDVEAEPESGIGDIGGALDEEAPTKRRWRLFRKGGE